METCPIKCALIHVSFLLIFFDFLFCLFIRFLFWLNMVHLLGYLAIMKYEFCSFLLLCRQMLIYFYINIYWTAPPSVLSSVSLPSAWRTHAMKLHQCTREIYVIIRKAHLLCPTRDFRDYFGHLGSSIMVSFVLYNHLLTWIVGICMSMVYMLLKFCLLVSFGVVSAWCAHGIKLHQCPW